MRRTLMGICILAIILTACNMPNSATGLVATPTKETVIEESATNSPTSIPNTETPPAKPLRLDYMPLYWFAPLPPLSIHEGRPFIGSDDFMKLFSPDAPWQSVSEQIQVFKLYGEWVAYKATDAELKTVIDDLKRRGLAVAVEAGPLNATAECGQGIEGFAGTEEGIKIANRIKNAGGTIHLLGMDEPYYFGHFYEGPNACNWSAERIASEIDKYIKQVRRVFPEILIGDTEPLAGQADAKAYQDWMDTFRQVNGYDLAFIHMDIDWSRVTWSDEVKAIEQHGKAIGIPVGIIYTGNAFDKSDEDWLSAAGERVKKHELANEGKPDHVLFQSWNDKPDYVLPESGIFTFSGFVKLYFEDKSKLGFAREGAGANIALGKPVRVSNFTGTSPGSLAVDGDLGTLWSSGGFAPQWIEIDLGGEFNIKEIRLNTSQYPEGNTVHQIKGRGANAGDLFVVLHIFDGNTNDGDELIFLAENALQKIRYIRVETISSPSWVAWREIEIIDAGE